MILPGAHLVAESASSSVIDWFQLGSARSADGPIPDQLWLTFWHAGVATLAAIAFAVPLAAVLAHYGKAELLSATIVNLGRVIPTITILGVAVLVSLRRGLGFEPWPILIALTVLTVPPIFANTYTAVRGVAPEVVAAARAMGLSERQILGRIELPLGAALVITGIRVALVQALATEVIGAYFGGEGLGAYIRQGLVNKDFHEVQAGALMVTGLAMLVDFGLWAFSRFVQPSGLRRELRRTSRSTTRPAIADGAVAAPAA